MPRSALLCPMLTFMLYGMNVAPALAVPMVAPADTLSGTSFEQAAAGPVLLAPMPVEAEPSRVDELGTGTTLALGLSLIGLARRRLPAPR